MNYLIAFRGNQRRGGRQADTDGVCGGNSRAALSEEEGRLGLRVTMTAFYFINSVIVPFMYISSHVFNVQCS